MNLRDVKKTWLQLVLLIIASIVVFLFIQKNGRDSNPVEQSNEFPTSNAHIIFTAKPYELGGVKNVSRIKSAKWIVVTSIQKPTADVERLASFEDWNLVVVADKKTPVDWSYPGVHFLSVPYQLSLPFGLSKDLPFASYTRKNIGYLYAIALGAEWIYDTDDDNKPFGKGLGQFDYDDHISGVRFMKDTLEDSYSGRLFNPYRFFGHSDMWPRGFPLHLIHEHNNGERLSLCRTMKRAAVQQGLVHRDSDVDAIYRLLEADPQTGLNVAFNKFAPPVILAPGTFSPWNSQNTLFHRSAFHTLFLPTTVSFRTTDIWRSYLAQAILHLAGDTISFVPVNAVQVRNAHDYLSDFEQEKQVFEQSGKIVDFLDNWYCDATSISHCFLHLAEDFTLQGFWKKQDEDLVRTWISDLLLLGYRFPERKIVDAVDNDYELPVNDTGRSINCRRMNLDVSVKHSQTADAEATSSAVQKLNGFGELDNWCRLADYRKLSNVMPSPVQLAEHHAKSEVLASHLRKVLVITNNYPWKQNIGILQRMYQPFFGLVIFCGTWNPETYRDPESYPGIQSPFNYVHLNTEEMHMGFFGYHCLTLVQEMKLTNVEGYFVMSDDVIFNIWQGIDAAHVFHAGTIKNEIGPWWPSFWGLEASERIVKAINESSDPKVLATWKEFENGLRVQGVVGNGTARTALDEMRVGKGWTVADIYYIPASLASYFSRLMRIFYDGQFFHELAFDKFLSSVVHQSFRNNELGLYLYNGDRDNWTEAYSADLFSLHPVKFSVFTNQTQRHKFCSTILKTFADVLFNNLSSASQKREIDFKFKFG